MPMSCLQTNAFTFSYSVLTLSKQDESSASAQPESHDEKVRRYRWCKCLCDPSQYAQDHYFLQMDTQVSSWNEPEEPYWLWNAEKQELDEVGLLQPASAAPATSDPPDEYEGYNPKIHGSYDPNAPYAKYHKKLREKEEMVEDAAIGKLGAMDYSLTGTFNRFTGNYQGVDKSAERHNDYNKSGRQMNAYFDVDAAANSHNGKSLKEERRNTKMTGKQIKELSEKRRAKKEKKRMDFYRS